MASNHADPDPMDAIPPSEVNDVVSDAGDFREDVDLVPAGANTVNASIQFTNTPAGVRTLLGRKQRKRPLLCIKCKGCSCTTHDEDPFVKGDPVECLGLIHPHGLVNVRVRSVISGLDYVDYFFAVSTN